MQFTNVRYLRRVNLGDYQHEEMEATAGICEGEDEMNAMELLRNKVNAILGVSKPDNGLSFTQEVADETPEVDEVDGVVEKPAKKVAKKTTKKAPAKKAPKTVAYNREDKAHKDEFAAILNDRCDGWKGSAETKAKAKGLSESLHGEPMFDAKGEILGEFADKVVEGMDLDEL